MPYGFDVVSGLPLRVVPSFAVFVFGSYIPMWLRALSEYQIRPSDVMQRRRGRVAGFGKSISVSFAVAGSRCPSLFVPKRAIQSEPSGARCSPYGKARGVATS